MFTVKVRHQCCAKSSVLAIQEDPPVAAVETGSGDSRRRVEYQPTKEAVLEPMVMDEVVFEARQVRQVRDGRLVSAHLDDTPGVQEVRSLPRAAGDPPEPEPVGHIYCDTETGQIVYPIRAVAEGGVDIIMFVMNRDGATVAKYYL